MSSQSRILRGLFGRSRRQSGTGGAASIVKTLSRNMDEIEALGGFADMSVLGHPVNMQVVNGGEAPLQLWLEPMGADYWLDPGENVLVFSYGSWEGQPFEVVHEPGRIEVWCRSWFGDVRDHEGNELLYG